MKQPTCAELILEQKKRELARIKQAIANSEAEAEEPEEGDPDFENMGIYAEGILAIERLPIRFEIQLSTGGPADGFIVELDQDGESIERAWYYYKDWFDSAETELFGSELDLVRTMFAELVCDPQ